MDINRLKQLVKDSRVFLALFGAIIIAYLIWSFVNSIPNPIFGSIPAPEIKALNNNKPTWVTDSAVIPELPKAGVYQVTKRGFTAKEAAVLATKIGIQGQPKFLAGTLLKWNSLVKELSLDLTTGTISYKKLDQAATFSGRTTIDKNFLAQKALDFITLIGIDTSIVAEKTPTLGYYRVSPQSNHADPGTEGNANMIVITFNREINGLSVVTVQGDGKLSVTLTTKGDVLGFTGSDIEIEVGDATYPLKNSQEVKEALGKGEGKIAHYQQSDSSSVVIDPSKVIVNQGQLKLLDDKSGEFIEPVYVFDSLAFKEFRTSKVEVYLPAITAKYLK